MINVVKIDWADVNKAVPAFLTIAIMPFTYSIAYGETPEHSLACLDLSPEPGKLLQVHLGALCTQMMHLYSNNASAFCVLNRYMPCMVRHHRCSMSSSSWAFRHGSTPTHCQATAGTYQLAAMQPGPSLTSCMSPCCANHSCLQSPGRLSQHNSTL